MKIEDDTQKTLSLRVFAVFFHPSTRVTAIGGAEKRFIETLKVFCKQANTKIIALEPSPSLLNVSGITCKKYPLSSNFHGKGWLGTYLEWGFWIVKAFLKSFPILRREKPNIILILNNTLPNLALGYIICLISHRPACAIVHHIDIPLAKAETKDTSLYSSYRSINYTKMVSLSKTFAFYITLPFLRKVNTIIAVSNFTAKALRDNNISKNRIFVSGNAIDFDFISKIKSYKTEKIFDGVFVGRISKEKGVFDLIEIWKMVAKNKENAKLLIVGSGLELVQLRSKIAEAGLEDNILIRGRCSDTELYSLLKSGKVFVFPSRFEGWGIAVAEALACNMPVVAYDIPALKEVFGLCKSVFLSPVGDIDKMAQTILKVLTVDNGKLGELSLEYAKNFEWKKVAATDIEAIRKTVAENFQ